MRARGFGDTLAAAVPAKHAEALQVIAANLTGDQLTLYCPVDAAPHMVWSRLRSAYAGRSGVRQASLLLQLSGLHPTSNETLDVFLSRSLNLRSELISAQCLHDTAVTCMWLGMLRERVSLLADWSVQNLQKEPVPPLPDLVSNLRATFLASLHSVLDCVEPSAHATSVPGSAGSRRTGSSSRTTADMCAYCSKGKHSILSCWKLRKDIRSFELSRGQPDPFVPGAIPSRFHPTASAVEAVTQHISAFPTAGEPAVFQTLRAPSSVSRADILLDTGATHDMVNCASHLHNFRRCTSHARLAWLYNRARLAKSAINRARFSFCQIGKIAQSRSTI
jgi:hypothetical protein